MADNVAITAGSGTTIAADDISGVLVQRVKTTWGPDGTMNDTDVASGKSLPVQNRASGGTEIFTTSAPGNVKLTDGTNAVAVKAASTNPGATDPALVVALSPNGLNANGQTTKANSAPVVPASDWVYNTGYYVAVAAGSTDSVIQSSAGATGDYLDHVVVIPATTAPGVVTVKDNSTAIISYPGGGTTALLTLTPFTIYVGAVSRSGAWKITTGSNVSIVAVGRFS